METMVLLSACPVSQETYSQLNVCSCLFFSQCQSPPQSHTLVKATRLYESPSPRPWPDLEASFDAKGTESCIPTGGSGGRREICSQAQSGYSQDPVP